MAHYSIIDDLKRKQILELLEKGQRIDGRALDEPRTLTIETGVIPKANGSARVRLGDTEVVAGVKVQPDRPFPDMGDKGIFICTAEILPLAHPDAEPGPPGEDVIELARVVDRGIRESAMIDLSQLVLEKDKSVIGVFSDNSVIDHDGNLFDACSYASTSAIISSKIPKWEMKDDVPTIVEAECLRCSGQCAISTGVFTKRIGLIHPQTDSIIDGAAHGLVTARLRDQTCGQLD